jgi:hypothetical protein
MDELLPGPIALGKMVASLLGRRVTFRRAPSSLPVEHRNHDLYTGLYMTGLRAVSTIICCDKEFAANSAAALSMISAEHAAEWLKAPSLPQDAAENFHEILNVMAVALNETAGKNPVSLTDILPPGTPIPSSVLVVNRATQRADYIVEIQGYPDGQVAILIL